MNIVTVRLTNPKTDTNVHTKPTYRARIPALETALATKGSKREA